MRLFLGIKIPDNTKKLIHEQFADLQQDYADARWVPERNYIISLQYFGEIRDVDYLTSVLEEVAFENEPFSLMTLSGGIFIDSKLTLYIDFYREKKIENIVTTLREKLQIEDKHKYIPQITVGKARVPSKQQYFHMKKKFEKITFHHQFEVEEIVLLESVLTADSPTYKEVKSFKLGG